jgi:tRNA(Ile)-lysidine synthase TilS/MesJ
MAKLCLDMQHVHHWRLGVAHFDHRWRADSAANAQYVQQLADSWSLPCHHTLAHEGVRTEADAREWRYSTLQQLALEHGCAAAGPPPAALAPPHGRRAPSAAQPRSRAAAALTAPESCRCGPDRPRASARAPPLPPPPPPRRRYTHVATGHTASDVVETLLFNLFRGGGTDGMQALAWKRPLRPGVTLVRPLLGLARQETHEVCRLAGIRVWEDETNEDLKYARNRIRNELLPYLRKHFNSRLDSSVAELAEIVGGAARSAQRAVPAFDGAAPPCLFRGACVRGPAECALTRAAAAVLLA